MKFNSATFAFSHGAETMVFVEWHHERKTVTIVQEGAEELIIDNAKRRYKPCETHALELIRHKLGQKPRTEFAKQRQAAAQAPAVGKTPQLKVHGGKR